MNNIIKKNQPDISIIIPFYNEEENIKHLISELRKYISSLINPTIEIIFIDDGSTDRSLEILKGLEHNSYNAKILKLSRNFGSHAAVRAGISKCSGKFITFVYADLQDPLSLIERLYNKCLEGYDIVRAEREKSNIGFFKNSFSKLYAKLIRKYVCKDFPFRGFDIVMFSEKVSKELNKNIESNSNFVLQLLTMGFNQSFILYKKQKRKHGSSKWTLSKKIKVLIDSFIAFSYAPIRFVTLIGICFSLAGIIWTIYIIIRTLIIGDLASGWPALISVLLIGFGITNISLGVIAEYLWRTLDASRKRPVFIIDNIINLSEKSKSE